MPGHVVFLEGYPHVRGGAQAITAMLATGLPERGWTVDVVAPSDGPALDALRDAGVHTTVLRAAGALVRYGGEHSRIDRVAAALALPRWTWHLARHLRRTGAVLLDVVDQRGVVLGAPAAAVTRVKGVWHVHTPGEPSAIDRLARQWARRCIAPSHSAAAGLGERTVVVPPALSPVPPRVRPAFGPIAPRLVTAGRLHPVKGFDVLIDAVGTLGRRHPTLTLDIYGDEQHGHERYARALDSQIARLGLGGRVRLRGHQPCPWSQWDGATAYVQPSRSEPFGLALVEAMACGLPVVATRSGGPADIIDDGRTGLLVPPNDPDVLARAIERVIDDADLARTMADAGRTDAVARYTVERLIDRTARVFDDALA